MRDNHGVLRPGFESWLADAGARHDGVTVREHDGQRALVAARPIRAGTAVVRVPRALIITHELVRASSLGRQIRDAGADLVNPHGLLAAWLAVEDRNSHSPFRPYLDSLPRNLASFPLLDRAAPALLTGTLAGDMLDELRAEIAADHARLQRVRMFRDVKLSQLVWARLCVGSRTFGIAIDGIDTQALIPFADMLNHDRGRHTRWQFDDATGAFVITAIRDLAAGDELFANYGRRSNSRLLSQYGFVVDDNPADLAMIPLGAGFAVSGQPASPDDQEILRWLRQQHPDADEARAVLAAAVRLAIAGFPSTLLDDDELLARTDLPYVTRCCVQARRGELIVLHAWLAHAERGGTVAPIAAPAARS